MKVLIPGGGGFLGYRLAQELLKKGSLSDAEGKQVPISQISLFDVAFPENVDARLKCVKGDLTDKACVEAALGGDTGAVFHLASVVSGGAEADFDLGMRVNLDGTRGLLDACRKQAKPPRFVFTSSVAVFGGELPEVLDDGTTPNPQGSYGAQKVICEYLVTDYSRKGYIDGRSLRLPTISVRPGKPNLAASSFASGIIREPLNGVDTVCPVTADMHLLLMSPRQAVECMIVAHDLGAEAFGQTHVLNLPGVTVTVCEMVEVLGKIAGLGATRKIHWEPDPAIQRIIGTWPTRWDARRAVMLGFKGDPDFESIVRAFIKDDLVG